MFKNKFLMKMSLLIIGYLGISALPIQDGKVKFKDDQKAKLEEEITPESLQTLIDAFNKELSENSGVKQINSEIENLLIQMNEDNGTQAPPKTPPKPSSADIDKTAIENIQKLKKLVADRDAMIAALVKESEPDSPLAILRGEMDAIKHSSTYLYASNKSYDAFENRPWNKKAAGLTTSATDFSDKVVVDKLNDDLDYYYRENPKALKSLHRDNFGLPSFWPRRTKVDDLVADGSISTAEITQARKLPWLPKNKQQISAEEGKIFPISIDIEWQGHNLSKIETSWLNSFNKEGSQAYKMSFVAFLVKEILKKARQEDRIATIKGIYSGTPDSATVAGRFLNRQNGLLYLAWKAREIDKKYRPFHLGTPTTANIVDYVDNMIKGLPEDVRNTPGLQYLLSPSWVQAYKRKYEMIHGTYNDYDGYPSNPKDYNNIKFVPLVDLEGSDFMAITFDDNIEILENIPAEKSLLHFEKQTRVIKVYGDYKLGIRFIHIGKELVPGDPDEFNVQSLWSNDVPILKAYQPIHDDGTGKIKATYNLMEVTDGWATDIVDFEGLKPGQVVKIRGNISVSKVVKSNTKFDLSSDFSLATGGTLTLYVNADNTLKELSRTTTPETSPSTDQTFNGAVIDADLGNVFKSVHTEETTIDSITNGVEGQEITIYGGTNTVNVVNVADNISVTSSAALGDEDDYIKLILIDGVWLETARSITA
jgi:hypothetical protein